MEATVRPRSYLTGTAITGIVYTLSWIAGLSVGAPSVSVNDSGAEVVAAFDGHRAVVVTQFVCTEGLPAAGLAVIALALAVAIVISGAGYLLLVPGLATVAYLSGVLLLVFVTGTGIVLGHRVR